jgi:hypothetical protein
MERGLPPGRNHCPPISCCVRLSSQSAGVEGLAKILLYSAVPSQDLSPHSVRSLPGESSLRGPPPLWIDGMYTLWILSATLALTDGLSSGLEDEMTYAWDKRKDFVPVLADFKKYQAPTALS